MSPELFRHHITCVCGTPFGSLLVGLEKFLKPWCVFPAISQSVSLPVGAAQGGCAGSEWGILRGFALGWLGRWPAAGWVASHLNQEKSNKSLQIRFLPECIPRHWHHSGIFYLAVNSDWYNFSESCSGFQSKAVLCKVGNTIFCRAEASSDLCAGTDISALRFLPLFPHLFCWL